MRRTSAYILLSLLVPLTVGVACDGPVDMETDTDGDGVLDGDDVCPATRADAAVDDSGCDDVTVAGDRLVPGDAPEVDLDGDGVVLPAERILAAPPATGEVIGGFYPIVLDRDGEAPHVFYANEAHVDDEGEAIHVGGDLTLVSPGGFIVLKDGDLTFPREGSEVVGVEGAVQLPLPAFGLLDGVEARIGASATMGYAAGDTLEVAVPLSAERRYLHFILESSAVLAAGDLVLSTDGPGALVVVDPHDPAVFLSGDLLGLGAIGPVEDVAIGLSFQGFIPFEPQVEPDRFESFSGNVFLAGAVPLPTLPLTLLGDTVVRTDVPLPDTDRTAAVGANGQLDVTVDVLGIPVFEARIAEGTAVVAATATSTHAEWVGRPTVLEFADALPLAGEASWMTGAAEAGETPETVTDIALEVDGAWLTSRLFVPVPNIPLGEGPMIVDDEGIFLAAPLGGELSLAGVTFGAGVDVELFFAPDGSDFDIELRGMANPGFGAAPVLTTVTITPAGVNVAM